MPCGGGHSEGLNAKTNAWLETLWSAGAPVDGALRLQALLAPPGSDDPNQPTASLGLAPLALPAIPQPGPTEAGILVAGAKLSSELRALRPDVANDEYGEHLLPVRQNGVSYWVFFRDVVPLEDAKGLIRPP